MTTYEPTQGSIVHIELYTEDPAVTESFYADHFGWKFDPVEEIPEYILWVAPTAPHGGMMQRNDDAWPISPPSTLVYIKVDDLAETRDLITEAGGEVLVQEQEVPERGIFTIYRDPGGIVAAAWEDQSATAPVDTEQLPMFSDEPETGSFVHFELYSEDPKATQAFHESVYGWTFESMENETYTMVYPPTHPYGGIMEANDEMDPGFLLYVLVDSAQDAVTITETANGKIRREPFDNDGWGTMAVVDAPGGIHHAFWEPIDMENPKSSAGIEAAK